MTGFPGQDAGVEQDMMTQLDAVVRHCQVFDTVRCNRDQAPPQQCEQEGQVPSQQIMETSIHFMKEEMRKVP
jgi:hypothetical protein